MALFKKKCAFCKKKINKGKEFFKEVKDPVYIGSTKKAFCCSGCANKYEEKSETSCCKGKNGGGCCG